MEIKLILLADLAYQRIILRSDFRGIQNILAGDPKFLANYKK